MHWNASGKACYTKLVVRLLLPSLSFRSMDTTELFSTHFFVSVFGNHEYSIDSVICVWSADERRNKNKAQGISTRFFNDSVHTTTKTMWDCFVFRIADHQCMCWTNMCIFPITACLTVVVYHQFFPSHFVHSFHMQLSHPTPFTRTMKKMPSTRI